MSHSRDASVGTEKFTRERFSILPSVKSKFSQTDASWLRSKSVSVNTDVDPFFGVWRRRRVRGTYPIVASNTSQTQTDFREVKDECVQVNTCCSSTLEKYLQSTKRKSNDNQVKSNESDSVTRHEISTRKEETTAKESHENEKTIAKIVADSLPVIKDEKETEKETQVTPIPVALVEDDAAKVEAKNTQREESKKSGESKSGGKKKMPKKKSEKNVPNADDASLEDAKEKSEKIESEKVITVAKEMSKIDTKSCSYDTKCSPVSESLREDKSKLLVKQNTFTYDSDGNICKSIQLAQQSIHEKDKGDLVASGDQRNESTGPPSDDEKEKQFFMKYAVKPRSQSVKRFEGEIDENTINSARERGRSESRRHRSVSSHRSHISRVKSEIKSTNSPSSSSSSSSPSSGPSESRKQLNKYKRREGKKSDQRSRKSRHTSPEASDHLKRRSREKSRGRQSNKNYRKMSSDEEAIIDDDVDLSDVDALSILEAKIKHIERVIPSTLKSLRKTSAIAKSVKEHRKSKKKLSQVLSASSPNLLSTDEGEKVSPHTSSSSSESSRAMSSTSQSKKRRKSLSGETIDLIKKVTTTHSDNDDGERENSVKQLTIQCEKGETIDVKDDKLNEINLMDETVTSEETPKEVSEHRQVPAIKVDECDDKTLATLDANDEREDTQITANETNQMNVTSVESPTQPNHMIIHMKPGNLRSESKIVIQVFNAKAREVSEVTSFAEVQEDGKIKRKTTVTTSKKVPVLVGQFTALDKTSEMTYDATLQRHPGRTPEPIVTSPPSTMAPSSPMPRTSFKSSTNTIKSTIPSQCSSPVNRSASAADTGVGRITGNTSMDGSMNNSRDQLQASLTSTPDHASFGVSPAYSECEVTRGHPFDTYMLDQSRKTRRDTSPSSNQRSRRATVAGTTDAGGDLLDSCHIASPTSMSMARQRAFFGSLQSAPNITFDDLERALGQQTSESGFESNVNTVTASDRPLEKKATTDTLNESSQVNLNFTPQIMPEKQQTFKRKPIVTWHETSSSTVTNEVITDPFKDNTGTLVKPKSVSMSSETHIDHSGKDSSVVTKSKAMRHFPGGQVEPAITSEAKLCDVPPLVQLDKNAKGPTLSNDTFNRMQPLKHVTQGDKKLNETAAGAEMNGDKVLQGESGAIGKSDGRSSIAHSRSQGLAPAGKRLNSDPVLLRSMAASKPLPPAVKRPTLRTGGEENLQGLLESSLDDSADQVTRDNAADADANDKRKSPADATDNKDDTSASGPRKRDKRRERQLQHQQLQRENQLQSKGEFRSSEMYPGKSGRFYSDINSALVAKSLSFANLTAAAAAAAAAGKNDLFNKKYGQDFTVDKRGTSKSTASLIDPLLNGKQSYGKLNKSSSLLNASGSNDDQSNLHPSSSQPSGGKKSSKLNEKTAASTPKKLSTELVTRMTRTTHPPEKIFHPTTGQLIALKGKKSKMVLEQDIQSGDGIYDRSGCQMTSMVTVDTPSRDIFTATQPSKGLSGAARLKRKLLNLRNKSSSNKSLAIANSSESISNEQSTPSKFISKSLGDLTVDGDEFHQQQGKENNDKGLMVTETKFSRTKPPPGKSSTAHQAQTSWEYSMECNCVNGLNTSIRTNVQHKRSYVPPGLTLYESSV